jgi:hypothetical protein
MPYMNYRSSWVLTALLIGSVGAHAQWLKHPTPGTPRTKDGKPNLSAPAPRAADGKPDLSGLWIAESASIKELEKIIPDHVDGAQTLGEAAPSRYFMNILWDFKPEEIVMTPAAAALAKKRGATISSDLPSTHCLPLGVPISDAGPFPHKIVQTPGLILVLYEDLTSFRQIYTDGRKLPVDPEPAFYGYSVGRWEGDTLVVDVAGFRDEGWLDAFGHPHSDTMRVTERFRRRDFGTMEVQITVDDRKMYNKPFSFKFNQRLMPDTDVLELFCENEKDRPLLVGNQK